MKLNKANLAGLTSPGQRSEMKSILAGTWPPLKPLPVFKYETAEYRATIDFDKKRGEWVCRKTSLPSNEVQELRGGLREITLALSHGEAERFIEGAEEQEPEFERETNRRLQAIRDWREKFANGARYFELREFLSERQRAELDDSLRLTLTARQLQFNAKNVADVFDDLSVAGGRFAALIEFANRKKTNPGADLQGQTEAALPEAESAIADDEPCFEISISALGPERSENETNNTDELVVNQEAEDPCAGAEEFPTLSIKDVFTEQELTPLAERMAHATSQQYEIEAAEILHGDSASLVESPHQDEAHAAGFSNFAARIPAGQLPAVLIDGSLSGDRIDDANSTGHPVFSSSRFPGLRISAFQANVFALLFLFAVTSFTVGLTVGRGPLGKRLRDAPKSLLATDAKPSMAPEPGGESPSRSDESSSRTPPPRVASSDDSASANHPSNAAPPEVSKGGTPAASVAGPESAGGSDSSEVGATDTDSPPTIESKLSVEPRPSAGTELRPEHRGGIEPMERSAPPLPARSKLLRHSKAVHSIRNAPRSRSPYRLASSTIAEPTASHLPRASTVLVTVPGQGSQPFKVSFPEKTIAATSSLAMTSQLSVFVSPAPGPAIAQKARLEAGELASFGWPRYSTSGGRYGMAETIRVRATIGGLGKVQEVKFLSGSAALLPATTEAIRQWRYAPTLLDKRAVQVQQDITIEFRPPQYSARLSTRHPTHNSLQP